jgi:dihydrofolate reductase
MARISLIAALDARDGIGCNNRLLCHLPADLQYFKACTMGKPVVMGHKTWLSIGRLLPGRVNMVLSRGALDIPGAFVAHELDEALHHVSDAAEVMIIGGAAVFNEALPQASRLYLTRIHHQFDADVFFPSVDWSAWRLHESVFRAADAGNPFDLSFELHERLEHQ